jgi:hypothetical protein
MPRNKIAAPLIMGLISGLVSACAANEGPDRRSSYDIATDHVDNGRYAQALPILRCVAGQGHGYEVAQYLAGLSAIRMAEDNATPELERADLRVEGFERLEIAANAGWPAAQAELTTQYFAVGHADALQKAAVWAAVYRHNGRDQLYGVDRIDDALEAQIAEQIGPEGQAAAEQAADAQYVTMMTTETVSPECQQILRSRAPGIMRQQRARPGRPPRDRPPQDGQRRN